MMSLRDPGPRAAAVVVLLCMPLVNGVASPAPEEVPPVVSAAWSDWYEAMLGARLAACPRDRATTYYFSPGGDDAGAGTRESPWRTLAKARDVLAEAPTGGNLALLFERGGVWRDIVGLDTSLPGVTIADYGDGPKPLFTAFFPIDPGGWSRVEGMANTFVRAEPEPVTWVKETEDLDRPYSRQGSAPAVEAEPGSWWWDPDGLLYVHPFHEGGAATDPRSDGKPYELTRPTEAGVIVRGDGSRIENIRAQGWGMQRTSPSQQHGIELRVRNSDRAVAVGCESHYGSSHAMVHLAAGAGGGVATFVDCRAGLTSYNPNGETVFNTFSYFGGQSTIFERCVVTHGTLASAEYPHRDRRRGIGFYAHTGGLPGGWVSLLVLRNCEVAGGERGCESPSAASDLPPAASIEQCRGFIVGELFDGGSGTGTNFPIAPDRCARVNGWYRVHPPPGAFALANWAQHGWVVNCVLEIDLSDQRYEFGLYNGLPGRSSLVRIMHSTIVVRSAPSVRFRFDYDSPNQSAGSSFVNSMLINHGAGRADPNLGAEGQRYNAYYGVEPAVVARDPRPVVLGEPIPPGSRPRCTEPVNCAAGLLPEGLRLEYDLHGPRSVRASLGPMEARGCVDFNEDDTVDFFDYLDFVLAYSKELPEADVDGNGQVDFFDYLLFVSWYDTGCP